MVAASLIPSKSKIKVYQDEEFALAEVNFAGRKVLVAKANGPGATVGRPGKFLLKLMKKKKINKIITVDAALRLEGEKPGSVAEGVGVAMGGTVDRYEIEEVAVKKNIPLDAVGIKVSDEEALRPMKKEILDAVPKATIALKSAIARSNKKDKILIIGVGNTCGVGNTRKEFEESKKKLLKVLKKIEEEKKKTKPL